MSEIPPETQKLTPEVIRKLVEKADPIEWLYLLKLSRWYRQGESYIDEQKVDVIYGEADIVELGTWDEGYPYRRGEDVLIIPKTVPTIIRVVRRDNTINPPVNNEKLLVFTKDGWKEVRIR